MGAARRVAEAPKPTATVERDSIGKIITNVTTPHCTVGRDWWLRLIPITRRITTITTRSS